MKRLKYLLIITSCIFICACLSLPDFQAMPKFMERYDADPNSRAELKGRCVVCHTDEEGFGRLNKFGQAFAKNGYRITEELWRQAPEAFTSASAEARKAEPQFDAKTFYAKNCAVCHGIDGKGGGSGMIVPNFSDALWQQRQSDEKLFDSVSKGKGVMPAFKEKLTEGQIKAMIALIRTFPEKK